MIKGSCLASFYLALVLGIPLSCYADAASYQEDSIEVLHWWMSGGESRAAAVIKDAVEKKGIKWKDSMIKDSSGSAQRRVLEARLKAKNPPDVVQLTHYLPSYAQSGIFESLDETLTPDKWSQIPEVMHKNSRYKNHWVAIPVNIQKFNWVWANKAIFDQLHLAIPKTYSELINACHIIKKAGFIPLARGGQPWQDALLFESLVASVGGAPLFKKVLLDMDVSAIKSSEMELVFKRLLEVRHFFDASSSEREWNLATSMVIHGKAAMQVMGDWAKGEFVKANKVQGVDYMCFSFPDTQNDFIFTSDYFGFVKHGNGLTKSQKIFAGILLDPVLQERFNLMKGSLPIRQDLNMKSFDNCTRQAKEDFNRAVKAHRAVEHFDIVVTRQRLEPIFSVITRVIEKGDVTPKQAVELYYQATKTKVIGHDS